MSEFRRFNGTDDSESIRKELEAYARLRGRFMQPALDELEKETFRELENNGVSIPSFSNAVGLYPTNTQASLKKVWGYMVGESSLIDEGFHISNSRISIPRGFSPQKATELVEGFCVFGERNAIDPALFRTFAGAHESLHALDGTKGYTRTLLAGLSDKAALTKRGRALLEINLKENIADSGAATFMLMRYGDDPKVEQFFDQFTQARLGMPDDKFHRTSASLRMALEAWRKEGRPHDEAYSIATAGDAANKQITENLDAVVQKIARESYADIKTGIELKPLLKDNNTSDAALAEASKAERARAQAAFCEKAPLIEAKTSSPPGHTHRTPSGRF